MGTKEQAEEFLENSRPAIEHIFGALSSYNEVLEKAQTTVEEIERSKQFLSDLFMYRDQWSPNANHHYEQYMMRIEELEKQKKEKQENDDNQLESALLNIGSSVESMSGLAGTILQIGKQSLSLRHSGKPNLPGARIIGTQNIVEVVWEGRNHAMHWEEGAPRERVRNMLNSLATDLNITIENDKNNCLSILGALGWKTPENVISDLKALVQ
jgi:membrane-associated HD superfamily phosphohydrolase